MQLLNTLYVTTEDTYLRLDNETLRVEVERETKLRVPLHHLCAVVCFGHVGLSAPLMHRLADEGIALVLHDGGADSKRVWRARSPATYCCARRSSSVLWIRRLRSTWRACVAGKIKNSRQVLQRGAREAKVEEDAALLIRRADDLAASLHTTRRRRSSVTRGAD